MAKNPFRSEAEAYRFVLGTVVYFVAIGVGDHVGAARLLGDAARRPVVALQQQRAGRVRDALCQLEIVGRVAQSARTTSTTATTTSATAPT